MHKIILLICLIFLSGCAGLERSEQTQAQFHTYTTETPVASDKLLYSDESAGHVIRTVLANDLPINTDTQTALDGKVDNSGDETVAGVKTCSAFPVSPSSAPTSDYEFANKKYVDDNSGGVSDDSLLEVKLDCTNEPTDGYLPSYDFGTGGFTWIPNAGGDLLADGVCTTPLLINGTTNVDDIWPGADTDIIFSMPAATNSAAGHMTAAHVTSLEGKGTGDMMLGMDQTITEAKQMADDIEFSLGTDQDIGVVYNSSNDRLEFKDDANVVLRYISAATGMAYVPQGTTAQKIELYEASGDGSHIVTITAQALSDHRTLTTPDKTGTIAVTTDLTAGTLDWITSGTINGNTNVDGDTAATVVLTAAECRGHIRYNGDNDVIDYTMPVAVKGLAIMIDEYTFAKVITVDTNGTENFILDGTALAAGYYITSPGTGGSYIVFVCYVDGTWKSVGRSGTWVSGGAD